MRVGNGLARGLAEAVKLELEACWLKLRPWKINTQETPDVEIAVNSPTPKLPVAEGSCFDRRSAALQCWSHARMSLWKGYGFDSAWPDLQQVLLRLRRENLPKPYYGDSDYLFLSKGPLKIWMCFAVCVSTVCTGVDTCCFDLHRGEGSH